ncbi:MAG: HlyD family efflux transporter periplasmic adaptor subunit [Polyangiaceae bacterium]|nr:HlyD family efflux transporter periplasmic adaptor subunit [Polyangiaceae bacterium]
MNDTPVSAATGTLSSLPRKRRPASAARWVRRLFGGALALAAATALVLALLPAPLAVETATVDRGPLVVTVDEDGRTRVMNRHVVSAPLGGNVARIELRAGDTLRQGDVLARVVPLEAPLLDPRSRDQAQARLSAAEAARRQVRAGVDRARLAADYARREAERTRRMVAQGAVVGAEADRASLEERSRNADLAAAEFGVKVADYEVAMARASLGALKARRDEREESLVVPSPIAGQVLAVLHPNEGVVQPGTPLLEVGDPAALEIVVDVLTADAVRITPGARVTLERWGGAPLAARVRIVEPSAFTRVSALGVEEQRVNVVVDLDEPYERWSRLRDGYRVEAKIVVWEAAEVARVPAGALFRSGAEWAAFVIRDGRAVRTRVEIAHDDGSLVEVLSGVAPGDHVIVHPSDRVRDGVRVEPR